MPPYTPRSPTSRIAGALRRAWPIGRSSGAQARRRRAFAGKNVLVTGASSGIGRALALRCGRLGARVLLVARSADKLGEVVGEIREAEGEAFAYPADLSDLEACDAMLERVHAEHGHVDVLVNNAGRSIRRPATESLERFHDYERTMQLNFFGPLRLIRGCLPGMRSRKSGHVVNVLSAGARMPAPNFSAYTASKAALAQLGDTLGAELRAEGVYCSSVYLSWVRTPMMQASGAFDENPGVMTPDDAAAWIVDAVVDRQPAVMSDTTRRRFVLAQVAPATLSRLLNIVWRLSGDDPSLERQRRLLRRFVRGKPM